MNRSLSVSLSLESLEHTGQIPINPDDSILESDHLSAVLGDNMESYIEKKRMERELKNQKASKVAGSRRSSSDPHLKNLRSKLNNRPRVWSRSTLSSDLPTPQNMSIDSIKSQLNNFLKKKKSSQDTGSCNVNPESSDVIDPDDENDSGILNPILEITPHLYVLDYII